MFLGDKDYEAQYYSDLEWESMETPVYDGGHDIPDEIWDAHLDDPPLKDKSAALKAVQVDGRLLGLASAALREDRDVVLAAVRSNGRALYWVHGASPFRDDEEIARAAVVSNALSLQYTSKRWRDNRAFVLDAVSRDGRSLSGASDRLRSDRAVVTAAVSNDGYALAFVGQHLRSDKEIVLRAMENGAGPTLIKRLGNDLGQDREVWTAAFEHAREYKAWKYLDLAPDDIKNDMRVVRAAMGLNKHAWEEAGYGIRREVYKLYKDGCLQITPDKTSEDLFRQGLEYLIEREKRAAEAAALAKLAYHAHQDALAASLAATCRGALKEGERPTPHNDAAPMPWKRRRSL